MTARMPIQQERDIITRYSNGQPANEIALELGLNKTTVYNALKRSGDGPHRKMAVINDEQQRDIAERYAKGERARDIAKVFGCDYATVYNIIRALGVETRFNTTPRPKKKPGQTIFYSIDEAAFDVLTPTSLYWLGFLFADGYVEKDETVGQRKIKVALSMLDIKHLEMFRAFCKSEHPIRHVERADSKQVVWLARSTHMAATLESYGLVIKRTRSPSPALAQSRDFWRGMVDGDGSVGALKSGNLYYADTQLVGQRPLLEAYAEFLRTNVSVNLRPYKVKDAQCWRIETAGTKADAIIRLLYENNVIALERKNERAQTIISGRLTSRFKAYGT